MPVDVVTSMPARYLARAPPPQQSSPDAEQRRWSAEMMSGPITLVGPDKRHSQAVQVKVYRTSLEHFAVVFPQKKVCRPLGVVNLRHATVSRPEGAPLAFSVRHKGCDAADASLTFVAATARDLDSWLEAFSPAAPSSPSATAAAAPCPLPAVAEDEEL
ncbi:uncharacterized protein LOC126198848 [Schistocerca nitens]|uniref:uncharacterized protein LOC126198848 n=1 Tax=Schistocerca nitens TaxID=7011 RepID=UPI0021172E18|nr:uncharacterized protein LOC126198848 [Schistocerca nitens]